MTRYSLFERSGKRSWRRIDEYSYPLAVARRVYQDDLLGLRRPYTHELRLRPVSESRIVPERVQPWGVGLNKPIGKP